MLPQRKALFESSTPVVAERLKAAKMLFSIDSLSLQTGQAVGKATRQDNSDALVNQQGKQGSQLS